MQAHQIDAPPDPELGGEGSGGAGALSFGRRIERYGRARTRTLEMVAYLGGLSDPDHLPPQSVRRPAVLADKLDRCGDWLRFHHYTEADQVRLVGASFCKEHLACAFCAIRRGSKALRSYLPKYEAVTAAAPQAVAQLVTMTVVNGPDLEERWRHLAASWRHLLRRRTKPRTVTAFRELVGAVWSYEVTNIGNGWHPHLHAVVVSQRPVDQDALAAEWRGITGDSFIVDVRPFSEAQEPADAFCEVFKYAVKFSDLSPQLRHEAWCTLRGRRLVDSAGAFRGVEIPDELTDDALDGPYVEMFYRYLRAARCYTLTRVVPSPAEAPLPSTVPG